MHKASHCERSYCGPLLCKRKAQAPRARNLRSYAICIPTTGAANSWSTVKTLMKANRDATEALQRTIGLMQKELERSVLSTQLLGKFHPLHLIQFVSFNQTQNHPPQLFNLHPRHRTRSISSSARPNNSLPCSKRPTGLTACS
jgi:hypothetical protein